MNRYKSLTISDARALWQRWAISLGAVVSIPVLSLVVSANWLPAVTLLAAWIMGVGVHWVENRHMNRESSSCSALVNVSRRTLVTCAIIMFVINVLYSPKILPDVLPSDNLNPELPYIACLIIFPVSMVFSFFQYISGSTSAACSHCHEHTGFFRGDLAGARLRCSEIRRQIKLLFWLSAFLTVSEWLYYHLYYINVNLNQPDKFWFIILPVALYVVSLVWLAIRYYALYKTFGLPEDGTAENARHSTLRLLMICQDYLLLCPDKFGFMDTPFSVNVPFNSGNSEQEAKERARKICESTDITVKYIYSSEATNARDNVQHYAVILPESLKNSMEDRGMWCTLDMVDRMLRTGSLSPLLNGELYRIFTITMAWKTYTHDGHRLYPIKHYKPTFRLRDILKWNVDYNDLSWLSVASNNQDRPMWRIRRFWRKYIIGLGKGV